MRKRIWLVTLTAFLLFNLSNAQDKTWKPIEGKITSQWGATINPENVLPEYPRPQMIRENWQNLNGLWNYTIQPKAENNNIPIATDGSILVPFAIESALSGVGKRITEDEVLWYKKEISIPSKLRKSNVLLHFGAVDWQADVFVNGKKMGTHKGGYDPFYFDITEALKDGSKQEIAVKVWDPTDDGPQPRGKQVKKPESIWYTPVSGIWQTVWLEAVPETHISATRQTPDIDAKTITVAADVKGAQSGDKLRISAWDGTNKVGETTVGAMEEAVISIENPKLWGLKDPFLYDLKVAVVRSGKVIDEIDSYFAMRKISMEPDADGVQRMLLNNEFVFQFGPLDQGWWPDGLYTPPTEEALLFDIEKTKEMGFNMIRKHVKVEPARWYYQTDKLGMLVWQDMPSGDLGNRWDSRPGVVGIATDKDRTAESEAIFREEWKEIMKDLHNFPSIVVWVPFNEAWGQFETREITEWTIDMDPSRLVNSASGGNFEAVGHIIDLHNYPEPVMPNPALFGEEQIIVLGEYGGLGLPVEGHTWQAKDNWGYQSFKNKEELFAKYKSFIDNMVPLISKGLSAAVYTQTTDVEIETNGLMTYDRKVIKMEEDKLKAIHQKLYDNDLVQMNK